MQQITPHVEIEPGLAAMPAQIRDMCRQFGLVIFLGKIQNKIFVIFLQSIVELNGNKTESNL